MNTPSGPHDEHRIGEVLREIIDQRGLRQKAVAERIHLSESSLSNILNGRARPRQVTLSRLIKQLEVTPEEQQRILAAYDHAEMRGLPEPRLVPDPDLQRDEEERVRHYLEIKAMSVAFEDDVESVLNQASVAFERSFREASMICDFFLPGPPRIALECKYNLNRDWDRALGTAKLLKSSLQLDGVWIIVPYKNEASVEASVRLRADGGQVVMVAELAKALEGFGKRGGGGE